MRSELWRYATHDAERQAGCWEEQRPPLIRATRRETSRDKLMPEEDVVTWQRQSNPATPRVARSTTCWSTPSLWRAADEAGRSLHAFSRAHAFAKSLKGNPQALEIPPVVRPFLRAWWVRHDFPASGPVFPPRPAKGTARRACVSFAAASVALLRAGVVRQDCDGSCSRAKDPGAVRELPRGSALQPHPELAWTSIASGTPSNTACRGRRERPAGHAPRRAL